MEASTIIQFISNVGFPIAISILLMFYMRENDQKHDEEIKNLREAIENNTIVMNKLIDKMASS